MSKIRREQRRIETIDENENILKDEEEINRLKFEIHILKLHISQQMNSDTMTFKDICVPQIDNVAGTSRQNFSDLLDVEAEIKNDLYTLAGFCCKKMGDQFVFTFQSSENGLHSNKNWIELFKIEEHWQLGKWVMPLSVDVQVIFAKYTIDSAASMKLFLKECKHNLDCYHNRMYEFMKLKAFLVQSGSSCVSLQTNYAYTSITINLVKAVCKTPEEARYIIMFLEYKKQEARPCRVIFDCEGENPLSAAETKVLKGIFKKIKEQGLKETMEKILTSDGSPFIWRQDSQDISIIDENVEEDSDGEVSFLKILKKNHKPKIKQHKVASKKHENDNEVSEDDDKCENDLSIDPADQSNAQPSEEDMSQVDIPKTAKKENKKAKSPKSKSLLKTKTKLKSDKKSKTSQTIGKKSLPLLPNRNDDVSDTGRSDGKGPKFIVPEIFKPKAKKTKGFLEDINAADTQSLMSAKKINKTGKRSKKTSPLLENSTVMPANRSRVQLMCSTPIARRPTNLPTVAEENISAIDKENMIIATEITGIAKIQDASAQNDSDESNLDESGSKDITKVENSQRELLKDLQAVKDKAIVTNKPLKRKAKSLAGGKIKVGRK